MEKNKPTLKILMLGTDICKLKFLPESSLYFKSVSRFKRFDDLAEIYIFNINRVNVLGLIQNKNNLFNLICKAEIITSAFICCNSSYPIVHQCPIS